MLRQLEAGAYLAERRLRVVAVRAQLVRDRSYITMVQNRKDLMAYFTQHALCQERLSIRRPQWILIEKEIRKPGYKIDLLTRLVPMRVLLAFGRYLVELVACVQHHQCMG